MDMTGNDSEQVNLRYKGQYDWGTLEARAYHEHTRHKMNFLEDKAFWYRTAAQPCCARHADGHGRQKHRRAGQGGHRAFRSATRSGWAANFSVIVSTTGGMPSGNGGMSPEYILEHQQWRARPLRRLRRMGSALEPAMAEPARAAQRNGEDGYGHGAGL